MTLPSTQLASAERTSWASGRCPVCDGDTVQPLTRMAAEGQARGAVGAGAKGATILNQLETQDLIDYAVDLNPQKCGLYVPGTGQEVIPPDFLKIYQPDVIIIANPIYEQEIRQHAERLELNAAYAIA